MALIIGEALEPALLVSAQEQFAKLIWQDGTKTAGATARQVKKNLQADLTSRSGAKLKSLLFAAISGHPVVEAYARPAKWSRLIVSRTEVGGGYGRHIDNSFMGTGSGEVRTDLSFTLFLSDPESYEGGELVIEEAGGTRSVKPAAGDLVIYPSTTLHEVAQVTSGVRYACVGWIQSRIRQKDQREILFDLENLRAELRKQHSDNSPELLTLSKSIANLTRMWAS